jgi:hypothetical protein
VPTGVDAALAGARTEVHPREALDGRILDTQRHVGRELPQRTHRWLHRIAIKLQRVGRRLALAALGEDADRRFAQRDGRDLRAAAQERPEPQVDRQAFGGDADLFRDLDTKLAQLGVRQGQQLHLERLPGDLAFERFGEAALDLGAHRRCVDQLGREQDNQRHGEREGREPEEDEFFQPLPIVRRQRAPRYWTLVLPVGCNSYGIRPWSNFGACRTALP